MIGKVVFKYKCFHNITFCRSFLRFDITFFGKLGYKCMEIWLDVLVLF